MESTFHTDPVPVPDPHAIYGPSHPPPPGPTPEEARAALALSEAAPAIPVRVRDLVLSAVAQTGIGLAILIPLFWAVPESWTPPLVAAVAAAVVVPFLFLGNLARSVPRGFRSKAGLAALLPTWFAIWVHSTDWSLGVQLGAVAAAFALAVGTVVILGLRRR